MPAVFNFERVWAKGQGGENIVGKSWFTTSQAPSEPPALTLAPASENLRLEWIHGYRAQDTRNNVAYNNKLEIVFPAASAIVLMKTTEGGGPPQQKFYMEHNDDVLCVRMHPQGRMCASGQVRRLH